MLLILISSLSEEGWELDRRKELNAAHSRVTATIDSELWLPFHRQHHDVRHR